MDSLDLATKEKFAFGNRAEVITSLVAGTEQHRHASLLNNLHTNSAESLKAAASAIAAHRTANNHSLGGEMLVFENRLKALQPKAEGHFQSLFNVSHTDYRQPVVQSTDATGPSYPNVLPDADVGLTSTKFSTSDWDSNKWELLEYKWGQKQLQNELLDRLPYSDVSGVVDTIIERQTKQQYPENFKGRQMHSILSLAQYEELIKKRKDYLNESSFVDEYLLRLVPSDDVDLKTNNDEMQAYYKRIDKFLGRLAKWANTYRTVLVFNQLKTNLLNNKFDEDLFLEYLKLPRDTSYISAKYRKQFYDDRKNDLVSLYSLPRIHALTTPDSSEDDKLVRDHLYEFLKGKDSKYSKFEAYISTTHLAVIDAEAKVLYGEGDPQKFASVSGFYPDSLKSTIEINILPTNPRYFYPKDTVAIDVQLKNVPQLIVKVFEINTARYYKDKLQEVPTDIQLDGLVANEEKVFKFDHAPIRRFIQKFDFPSMKRRGVFVVEFIGNGKSSRCVIRKGKLAFVDRTTAAGHVFTVVDEYCQHIPKASIWLAGHQFRANDTGSITVPFTKSASKQTILLVNEEDGFTSLDSFQHQAENYTFDARFFVDREALVSRAKAAVLIRAQLSLNNNPIALSLLEEVVFSIKTRDIEDTDASKDVRNLKFENDKDVTVEFKVPDRLQSISFSLTAKVKNMSTGAYIPLSASNNFTLNAIEKSSEFKSWFLRRTSTGYQALLLGKSGEPLPNRAHSVSVKHRLANRNITFSLSTNENGATFLGQLKDVEWVELSGEGQAKRWPLAGDSHTMPVTINAKEGDEINIANMDFLTKLEPSHASLVELRGDKVYAHHFDKLSYNTDNGMIVIKGLEAGNYKLFLKKLQQVVTIAVTKGTSHSNWIFGAKRNLEVQDLTPLQISKVDVTADNVKITLKNHSEFTRVHVVASEFIPEYQIRNVIDDKSPGAASVSFTRMASDYLNGRTLGEEYRYILERKFQKVYAGNTLTRPSLLLQPWAVQSTSTDKKEAKSGDNYAEVEADYLRAAGRAAAGGAGAALGDRNSNASYDFKKQPSIQLANLKPNAEGIITIEASKLGPNGVLRIVALDFREHAFREVILPNPTFTFKDLRLQQYRALNPEKHYTEQKHLSELYDGESFVVQDITTTKIEFFDTLSRVSSLFLTLSNNNELREFTGFALNWTSLSEADKQEKFNKYSCHELNIFIYKKDPSFFKRVIQPYIVNKKEKTFIDFYLLEQDLTEWLQPHKFKTLNMFEKILAAERTATTSTWRADVARSFEDKQNTVAFNTTEFNRLFLAAIKGSELDTEDKTGFEAAAAREAQKREDAAPKLQALAMPSAAAAPPPSSASESIMSRLSSISSGAKMKKQSLSLADYNDDEDDEGDYKEMEKMAEEEEEAPVKRKAKKEEAKKDRRRAAPAPARSAMAKPSLGGLAQESVQRAQVQQFFQQVDTTQEYAETNYWKIRNNVDYSSLVSLNGFWVDYAKRDPAKPFLSRNFIDAWKSFPEMMFALAVLDLPLVQSAAHTFDYQDSQMTVKAKSGIILVYKDVKDAPVEQKAILTSQNFFDPSDRYITERGEQTEKYVDEFLRFKVYGCHVVITNVSASRQRAEVLIQVPVGAIPVSKGQTTKSSFIDLSPYTTTRLEYYFYWPATGVFDHFPVHVSREEKVIAWAKPVKLHVVPTLTKHDKKSWEWVVQMGTEDEVLAYLKDENVWAVDVNRVCWRLHDAKFFARAIPILRSRCIFSNQIWRYGFKHSDMAMIKEYIQANATQVYNQLGAYLKTDLIDTNPILLKSTEHLEYWPLVNARAHQLGAARQILNDRFKDKYASFLKLMMWKPVPEDEDLMSYCYYLLLQDRIQEAKTVFARVSLKASSTPLVAVPKDSAEGALTKTEVSLQLQYDYLAAYLDFFNDEPTLARKLVPLYDNYPVVRWNKLFSSVKSQLKQIDEGLGPEVVDSDDRNQKVAKMASTDPSLEFDVVGNKITVTYQALTSIAVRYFKMDIELLFSSSPFVQSNLGSFAYVMPNFTEEIQLPKATTHTFDIPEQYRNENLMIDISSGNTSSVKAHFSHSLWTSVQENYGQVRVCSKESGKPLSKVYCKVYARHQGGDIRFYKDGYTDLRGGFDYTGLNTPDLTTTQKFSILIMSEKNGTRIVEAAPPKQ